MIKYFLASEKNRMYMRLACGALALLVLLFFVVPFLFGRIKATNSKLTEMESSLAIIEAQRKNMDRLESDYLELQPKIDTINKNLLKKDGFLDLILTLEDMAEKSNNRYDIKLISEYEEREELKLPVANLQIYLWGDFGDLMKFLFYLENMPYLNRVKNLQIQRIDYNRPDQNIEAGDVASKLDLEFYVFSE